MKEMLGGCCVCSDDSGWAENPLVYCDGQGCNVAVHQACYGIVTVPIGNWFCRKCESQEKSAKVRCELCPSKDGALKRTDNNGWAHVVCALYIPEVRFGNVTSMEPILLEEIPPERFNKVCYICEENGHKGSRSKFGACMMCNKPGCRQQFHVTCAQTLGLLCEEAGNYLDNVKYCGYCSHHYSKLVRKKGANIKPIPPYRPASSELEKDAVTNQNTSDSWSAGKQGPKRKKSVSSTPDPKMESNENAMNLLSLSVAPTPSDNGVESGSVDNGSKQRKRRLETPDIKKQFPDHMAAVTDSKVTRVEQPRQGSSGSQQNSVLMPNPNQGTRNSQPSSAAVPATSTASGNSQIRDPRITQNVLVSIDLCPTDWPKEGAETIDLEPSKNNTSGTHPEPVYEKITPESSPEETRRNKVEETSRPLKYPALSSQELSKPPALSPSGSANTSSPAATNGEDVKKTIQNGSAAPHIMLGNQLNPNSTMAKSMTETLNSECEAHSIYTAEPNLSSAQLVGPPLPTRHSQNRSETSTSGAPATAAGNSSSTTPWSALLSSSMPPTLDQLLERQWDLGSQFLMEQAQNYDIAALLTCLHKLRTENSGLEDQVTDLMQRRDQLLAINARLAVSLTPPVNNVRPPAPAPVSQAPPLPPQSSIVPPVPTQQAPQIQQQRSSTILHAMPVGGNPMHPPTSRGPPYQSHPMEQQQYQRIPVASPQRQPQPMPQQGLNFRNIGVQGRTVVMRSSPSFETNEFESFAEEQNYRATQQSQHMNYQNHVMYNQQMNRNEHHSKGGPPHPHSKPN